MVEIPNANKPIEPSPNSGPGTGATPAITCVATAANELSKIKRDVFSIKRLLKEREESLSCVIKLTILVLTLAEYAISDKHEVLVLACIQKSRPCEKSVFPNGRMKGRCLCQSKFRDLRIALSFERAE